MNFMNNGQMQALAVMYSMRSCKNDIAWAVSASFSLMPLPTVHIERLGAHSSSVFTSKYVSLKASKGGWAETYISRIVGGEVFLLCTR